MFKSVSSEIDLITGNSNRKLAQDIADDLDLKLHNSELTHFADGETRFEMGDSVRGKDVYIIQSTSKPTNENLMDLLVMVDSAKRASAGSITAVIPYFGYARQDRKAQRREPITAKLVANLIEKAGVDRVITMDLHAPQIQGFFDIPVDDLHFGKELFRVIYNSDPENNPDNVTIVAPDAGSVKRNRKFTDDLNTDIVIIDKKRDKVNQAEAMHLIGDVEGQNCIMIDDIIDTGGTIISGAKLLKEKGAKSVKVGVTHGVFSKDAIQKLNDSDIDEVYFSDTIEYDDDLPEKFKKISTRDFFKKSILLSHYELPFSDELNNI